MNNLQSTELHAQLENQITKQPPDLRFCRAWWLFKKALYPKLGNAALRVFLVLEDRASRWNDYQVPMSLSTLGDETGVRHHTTLANGIRELEAAGVIAVTRQVGNSRQANIYALLIHDLIGDEQAVFGSRSNFGSGSNAGEKCDCGSECQTIASVSSKGKGKGSDNSKRATRDANISSNQKIIKAESKVKVTGKGKICSSQNSHAYLAAAGNAPTSAEIDVLEGLPVNCGSAKIDTVLTCSNTNITNKNTWLNPDGFNGVAAVKIQPVKAKFDQRELHGQELAEHDSQLPGKHGQVGSVAITGGLSELAHENSGELLGKGQVEHVSKPVSNRERVRAVTKPVSVQLQGYTGHGSFETSSYFYQPQKRNMRQLREEYFKRLSWAMNHKERMSVLFSALRLVLGEKLGKADFSGFEALVSEHGAKAVLAGIMATIGREVGSPAYFAYLRGVIRNQEQNNAAGNLDWRTGKFDRASRLYQVRYREISNINLQSGHKQQLPINPAKYTGNGKYAHLIDS